MSVDDGLGVVIEGDENTLGLFSRAFIFVGNPEVFVIEHEDVRSMKRFRDRDVVLGDQFFVVVEPRNGGLLNGKVMGDIRAADQAGGGGAGVLTIAPGFVQNVGARAGEHVILLVVVIVMGKPLHEPVFAKQAKEFVGRLARLAKASGQESKGGKPKFPEPVQDDQLLISADGSGIFECGITVDNAHETTSFSSV